MQRPLVILGSARSNGETRKAIDIAFPAGVIDLIMLNELTIAPYDYRHRQAADGFLPVVDAMLATDSIVLATPVYWYAMSAPLKIFFDRLTDLTENLKFQGKAMAGKSVWVIVTGTEEKLPEGFEIPFSRTADYFSMRWCGGVYLYTGTNESLRKESKNALIQFGAGISA